jgi:hypothetical protein
MRTVDGLVSTLTKDASKVSVDLPENFRDGFIAFVREWRAFYDEHSTGVGAWWSRGTTATYNKVLEYRELAMGWRDRFVKLGGKPSSIPLPKPREFSIWPYAIGAGIVFGATYFLFRSNPDE